MMSNDNEEDDGTWSCPPVEDDNESPPGINQRASYRWIRESQFLRADGTWATLLVSEKEPWATIVEVKEPDPPGSAATLALGAAAVAAKNPVVSRRFWRRK